MTGILQSVCLINEKFGNIVLANRTSGCPKPSKTTLHDGQIFCEEFLELSISGSDISTWPLSPASEFLKNWLSGTEANLYILVFNCPAGKADFQSSPYIFMEKMWHECLVEMCKQCHKIKKKMII